MAINLASKYSPQVDEAFTLASVSEQAVNQDYEFSGVKTVNVYQVSTSAMNDYTRSGSDRYGTAAELADTVQELTLTKDRSFTFTIDRGNNDEQLMIKEAGKSLRRQIDEVVTPEVDKYRLNAISIAAPSGNVLVTTLTTSNAVDSIMEGTAALDELKVPQLGRLLYVTPATYKKIKLDDNFIKASDIGQDMLIKGQVGEVDGMAVVRVPASYLPAKTNFLITHKVATCAPITLNEYKVHDNPPGISGWLVEGRIIYDAFVLTNKKNAIAVCKTA